MKYKNKKAAPPLPCVSAGKRHTLPNPIAEPTVAAINPIFENCTFAMIEAGFIYDIDKYSFK
jgi:hypothetical protein